MTYYVRCCKVTKEHNCIILDRDDRFYLLDNDKMNTGHFLYNIEYCPWCGKLLDVNLMED